MALTRFANDTGAQSSPTTTSRSKSSLMCRVNGNHVRETEAATTAQKTDSHAHADTVRLLVTYTDTYPDEPPELELDMVEGDVLDAELQFMLDGLKETADESIGMVSTLGATPQPGALSDGRTNRKLTLERTYDRPWCLRSPLDSRN